MSRRHYKVVDVLDGAGATSTGTVTIESVSGTALFHVRPFRRRRVYTLPLPYVATMVCRAIILAELREKRAAKKKRRRS